MGKWESLYKATRMILLFVYQFHCNRKAIDLAVSFIAIDIHLHLGIVSSCVSQVCACDYFWGRKHIEARQGGPCSICHSSRTIYPPSPQHIKSTFILTLIHKRTAAICQTVRWYRSLADIPDGLAAAPEKPLIGLRTSFANARGILAKC